MKLNASPKAIMAITLIAMLGLLFGAVGYLVFNKHQANLPITIEENIKNQAGKIMELNNIKEYSLKSMEKNKIKLPEQFEISKTILAENFPDFIKYINNDVWQVNFNGEIKELEYGIIFDPNGEYVIAAFKNDKRAVPGIEPLKIKEKNLMLDPRCSQKAKVSDICSAVGFEFNLNEGKCVVVNGAGCIDKLPFGSLKECQKTCESGLISGNELKFETIEKENYSSNKERKNYIINNINDWKDLLRKLTLDDNSPKEYISIDFTKDMIAAVFQGEKSTGGYDIEINKIMENKNTIEVSITEIFPGSGCMVTEAFTSPYHIVKLQKSAKEVVFNIAKEVTDCR